MAPATDPGAGAGGDAELGACPVIALLLVAALAVYATSVLALLSLRRWVDARAAAVVRRRRPPRLPRQLTERRMDFDAHGRPW